MLVKDGLVILPSDTAYGLAANACSLKAVQKVYDFKGRRFGKGLSVFLKNLPDIRRYADCDQDQWELIKTLLPGPYTVVLESKNKTVPAVEPGDGTLGIRVVNHPLIREILNQVSFPVTATSANLSGKGPHYSAESLIKTLSGKKKKAIDLVIDASRLPRRPTSTLVRLAGGKIKVLRRGSLDLRSLVEAETKSEIQTKKFAQNVFRKYLTGKLRHQAVVVILKGDLGSGKTVFAKGIGELFGLKLSSPTFVLMDEHAIKVRSKKYEARSNLRKLYHLDLYRIENEEEISELGLEQFLRPGNLIMIEWGEKLSVFEKLKLRNTAFFLLQIADLGLKKRKMSLYKI